MAIRLYNPRYPDVMTCVYRLYSEDGELLYIGVAYDFDKRFKQHAYHKEWWPEVRHKDVTWYATRLDALYEERRAIAAECPKYNDRTGLSPVGLAIVSKAREGRQIDFESAELAIGRFYTDRVWDRLMYNGTLHGMVTFDGVPLVMLVPVADYLRMCEAMGKAVEL